MEKLFLEKKAEQLKAELEKVLPELNNRWQKIEVNIWQKYEKNRVYIKYTIGKSNPHDNKKQQYSCYIDLDQKKFYDFEQVYNSFLNNIIKNHLDNFFEEQEENLIPELVGMEEVEIFDFFKEKIEGDVTVSFINVNGAKNRLQHDGCGNIWSEGTWKIYQVYTEDETIDFVVEVLVDNGIITKAE